VAHDRGLAEAGFAGEQTETWLRSEPVKDSIDPVEVLGVDEARLAGCVARNRVVREAEAVTVGGHWSASSSVLGSKSVP
jgi:hypothetical protein